MELQKKDRSFFTDANGGLSRGRAKWRRPMRVTIPSKERKP